MARQGRHVRSYVKWRDADYKPAVASWPLWLPTSLAAAWVAQAYAGGTTYSLRRMSGAQESWRAKLARPEARRATLRLR